MCTSSRRRLKTLMVFLSVQIFKIIQCEPSQHASIPELLAKSDYCQVKVIYDQIGDKMLQPVSSSNFYPLVLIGFGGPEYNTMHLPKIQNSECKISFIVFRYYYPGNLDLRQPYAAFWLKASEHQFKIGKASGIFQFTLLHTNVHKILISAINKTKTASSFKVSYRILMGS